MEVRPGAAGVCLAVGLSGTGHRAAAIHLSKLMTGVCPLLEEVPVSAVWFSRLKEMIPGKP